MKKFSQKFGVLGWVLLIAVVAMGARIGGNILRIGDLTGSDIEIRMGAGRLKWDDATSKMQFSNDSGASVKEIGSGGGAASGVNLLENADFETGSPPDNWTASGGTFISETGAPGFDLQSGSWDASAGAENLDSDLQGVPLGLEDRSCNATIQYKYTSGAGGDYKLQVLGNTAGLIAEKDLNLTTDWAKDALQFTCPSSDSIRIRITSTTNGGIILVDNATLGKTDFVDINQATLVGSAKYVATTSCVWSRTSTSQGAFTTQAACPALTVESNIGPGVIQAVDNDLPQMTVNSLPAGTYVVEVAGQNSSTASAFTTMSMFDGVTRSGQVGVHNDSVSGFYKVTGVFTYATSGNRTFELHGASASGTLNLQVGDTTSGNDMVWYIYRVPSSAAEAITLETTGWLVDVAIGGANPSLGTSAVSTFTGIEDAGLTLVNNSQATITAKIPCSGTNSPTGLTCSVGNESLGVNFVSPQKTKAYICGYFTHSLGTGVSSNATSIFSWVKTPSNAQTITTNYETRLSSGGGGASGDNDDANNPLSLCSIVDLDAGEQTLRIFYEQFIGAGTITNSDLLLDQNASAGDRQLRIVVFPINNQFPTPVFTDLTTSLNNKPDANTTGLRIVSAQITNGGVPAVGRQDGTWIDSVDDDGLGLSTINISGGIFSSAPNCTCTIEAAGGRICAFTNAITSTTVEVTTQNNSGTNEDRNYNVICIGPK